MHRREYLLGVTGATAMLAGCDQLEQLQGTETEDDADEDEPDPPQVQVVREYYRLLDSGDVAEANELIHPDSPQGEVSTDRAEQYRDELTISVGSVSLAETGGDTATVHVAVRLERTETGETEERSLAVELRETDEGWRLYDSRQREERDSGETDDGGSDTTQVRVVREYYRRLNDGNITGANELVHPDSPQGRVSPDRSEDYRDELDISVRSSSLHEVDGDRATVHTTVLVEQRSSEDTQRTELAVELRRTGDGWRLYDSTPRGETTGETDDNEEVANQLQVVSTFGTDIESGEVRTVQLVLIRAPGSAEIDLTRLTVQWVDNSGSYDLTYGPRVSEGTFAIEGVQDDNDSLSGEGPILDDAADRALLQVSVPAVRDSGLPEGASASVRLSIASGRSSDTILQVPDTLVDGEAVQL